MRVTIGVEAEGVTRAFDVSIGQLSDLDRPLKHFAKYFRERVKAKFAAEGPGWAPLSAATLARRALTGKRQVEKSLARAVRKKAVEAYKAERKSKLTLGLFGKAAVKKKRAQLDKALEKFNQARDRGASNDTAIGRRVATAQGKARSGPLLGKLASSIQMQIGGGSLVASSRAKWAGVHNDGGGAGHGANEPKREFLAIDAHDVDVLAVYLQDYILEPLTEGE